MEKQVARRQLVFGEMEHLIADEKPIRVCFSPGTDAYFYITALANETGMGNRDVVRLALKELFIARWEKQNESTN